MEIGKFVNLLRLTDGSGRFKMLAVDQRDSLQSALARAAALPREEISARDLTVVKTLITELLSPLSSAVLVDPVYGLADAAPVIPPDVGILVAVEETGYEARGPARERMTRLIEGWSVAKAKRAGANAVKLLLQYNPEASSDVLEHQRRLALEIGQACLSEDLPFLLELVTYPLEEPSADTMEFARMRPRHAAQAAAEFSAPKYHVDILKLEFPADLKYTREFAAGAFDGKDRQPAYRLDEVRGFCRDLDAAAGRPWIILSGGVGIGEFLVALELAVDAGASGFLCGRAIWQHAIARFPDLDAVRTRLAAEGTYNFARANATADRARPWSVHPSARENRYVPVEGWYRAYGQGGTRRAIP